MPILVHHRPTSPAPVWNIHFWQTAWDGNLVVDDAGAPDATGLINFQFPDIADPRKLQFKYYSSANFWEPDTMTRRLLLVAPAEIWTFDSSPRIVYTEPNPAGVVHNPGDVLTFQVITQQAFRGGQIYVWNPYDASQPSASFPESARDDVNNISTFTVALLPWMTSGFHLKLVNRGKASNGGDVWESDTANRVWRPCDGSDLWLKSGQCDLRNQQFSLTPVSLEVLYPARVAAPPSLILTDTAEGSTFQVTARASQPYPASPMFAVASYAPSIFPGAGYSIQASGLEEPPLQRPFPADPSIPGQVSRFLLGTGGWVAGFPLPATKTLSIQPQQPSSFTGGLAVDVSLGNGPVYDTQAAKQQADGSWQARFQLLSDTITAFDLRPAANPEPKPYDWIDTSRYYNATGVPVIYTAEGVYGLNAKGPTRWAEPASRADVMRAVYGNAVVAAGVFAARELPHGATIVGNQTYFVVHAPHAAYARLILVNEQAPGGPVRTTVTMSLTRDTFYWWCMVPLAQAPPNARYRFLLNDSLEVLDPAARAVSDQGGISIKPNDDPRDPTTSWSMVLDVASVYATAHAQSWQTMGWQNLLIYEIHPRRFSNLALGSLSSFELLIDEMRPISRLGQPGYLRSLPVTAFGLMPVNEFNSAMGWGYDPSYYFAIDGNYGGAASLADFVNAAHAIGRAVTMDVVYNHSLGSSLMSIAPDVYRNGNYDGDRMNCGHPMVREFLRQASVYLFRTFNLDGFRFDDTKTIVQDCVGGWDFLGAIRSGLRGAASAELRAWPYCVAENSYPAAWNVSNPAWSVLDGEWGIDESFRILDASYATWAGNGDCSEALKAAMDAPSYWGRPFFQATRFGESHDMVSAQNQSNQRIAARPPFGQGYLLAKALGALTLLTNGIPMLFMGQEYGETTPFYFGVDTQILNPQQYDKTGAGANDNTRILAWFRQIMGLRNDSSKGLQGDANFQVVAVGNRTVAFTCGAGCRLFAVITFGTPNQQQDSGWLGLPPGATYKEIFNSSWPAFQVAFESEHANGGYDANISSGQILQLPFSGAVILERN
jgi:1,4-alpha-glucan branching enzyme